METNRYFITGMSVILILLMVFVGYRFDLNEWQQNLSSVQTQTTALKQQVIFLKTKIHHKKEQQAALVAAQQQFNSAITALPAATQMQPLLDNIADMARKNHLVVVSIKQWPKKAQDFYSVIPVQIVITGEYQNIINFITAAGNIPQIFHWKEFILSRQAPAVTTLQSNPSSNSDDLMLNISANFYQYPP